MRGSLFCALFGVAVSFSFAGMADAAPYRGETFALRQPDGSAVQVRIWGDEYYQHVEGLDGHTLTYDKTGWIQYAGPPPAGANLVATGIAYTGSIEEGLQNPDPGVRSRYERIAAELQRRGIVKNLKESREVRQEIHRKNLESVGLTAMPGTGDQAAAAARAASPLRDTVMGLCLLVDFVDDPVGISRDELDDFWNLQDGYAHFGNNGSVRRYYLDISGNMLDLRHHVMGYYRASHPKPYYTDPAIPYGQRAAELLQEALNWIEGQGFDFATLSTRDGYVVSCYMMYAGGIENNWAEGLWPHAGGTYWSADGVAVGRYACGNVGNAPIIGLEVHETGHSVCGWPDLYDYDSDSAGAGNFGMAGAWDGNPDVATSFFRAQKGWMNVIEVNGALAGTTYDLAANLSPTCLRYSRPGVPTEYFMLENFVRETAGRRPSPPDQGVLVWHVDEYGSNSNQEMTVGSHYYASVEQADGLFELERNVNSGGDGDLYHAAGTIRFDDQTLPDTKWWDGTSSGFQVSDVGPIGLTTSVIYAGDPVAACCSSVGTCATVTQASCAAPSVWYPGLFSCSPNPCPPPLGSCCATDGSCAVTLETGCAGIIWLPLGTCDPNPCPLLTGSCCATDGGCVVTLSTDCAGTVWMPLGACDPNPCPPSGACCSRDGTCCVRTWAQCPNLANQTFLGIGTVCEPDPCLPAASASVVAWGGNDEGQCNVPSPNSGFVAVAGGRYHSLGLKSDGTIVAWGGNGNGQCDVPSSENGFVAIAAGGDHSLGLKSDGTIVAWGGNGIGQCDVPSPNAGFVAVEAGWGHSMGLKSDGSIVAWGGNPYGECDVPSPNACFVAIAAGETHSLGLKSDGRIVGWGSNWDGQCDVPAPNAGFVAVAGGFGYSLGLRSDGTIAAWGYSGNGRLDVPEPNTGFVAIAASFWHSLGLRSDGSIVAWGNNYAGECNVPTPNADFVAGAAGGAHTLGLRRSPPAHCDFVATGLPYIVVIDNASKDGGSLDYGDVVGLFATYQDRWICVGSAPYQGSWPLSVPAMEADPGHGLPGFVPGDPIVLELCASAGDSLVGTPYWRQNGVYGAAPYSAASYVEFRSPWCHREIPLQANRWEWIGLGLDPADPNAASVFGSLGWNLKIAMDDEGHAYIPGQVNNLSPLGIENGYRVFLGDSPATLEVTGSLSSLDQDCIPIVSNRWNLIPYLTDSCGVACALDIGQAMGAWADSIIIVQNDAGDVWIPEQAFDTIGTLDPRLGYYLFPRATTSFDICYPSCLHGAGRAAAGPGAGAPVLGGAGSTVAEIPASLEQPSFYSVQETGMPEIVLVTETSDGLLSDGDEIAVLCDGGVVGAVRFQGSLPFVVPVWRGSAEMGLTGFTPGAPMTAELWDRETGRQVALAPVTEDGQSATFRFEPYSRVRLGASVTSTASGTLATGDPAILWARPNPSRGLVEIACRLPRAGDIPELEIYDSAGRLIRRILGAPREGLLRATWDGTTDTGSRVASGVYFLRLKSGAKGTEQRLLILR